MVPFFDPSKTPELSIIYYRKSHVIGQGFDTFSHSLEHLGSKHSGTVPKAVSYRPSQNGFPSFFLGHCGNNA
jgi:hypothetical protein